MKLILHVGINKTASSYLQTILTLNRDSLIDQGIYVPACRWDNQMSDGIITPGNGHELAWALHDLDEKDLLRLLQGYKKSAEEQSCDAILISNEVLVRLFSNPEIQSLLSRLSASVGFDLVKCIAFSRELVSHALSLYKHRAKTGKHQDIRSWFENDYETLRIWTKICKHRDVGGFNWRFLEYTKNSDELLGRFFRAIGVDYSSFVKYDQAVNPSLGLNEIRIVQFCREYSPCGIDRLSNALRALPKTPNEQLESYFRMEALNFLGNNRVNIQELSKDLGIAVTLNSERIETIKADNFILSPSQRNLVMEYFGNRIRDTFIYPQYVIANKIKELFGMKKFGFDTARYGGGLRSF